MFKKFMIAVMFVCGILVFSSQVEATNGFAVQRVVVRPALFPRFRTRAVVQRVVVPQRVVEVQRVVVAPVRVQKVVRVQQVRVVEVPRVRVQRVIVPQRQRVVVQRVIGY